MLPKYTDHHLLQKMHTTSCFADEEKTCTCIQNIVMGVFRRLASELPILTHFQQNPSCQAQEEKSKGSIEIKFNVIQKAISVYCNGSKRRKKQSRTVKIFKEHKIPIC